MIGHHEDVVLVVCAVVCAVGALVGWLIRPGGWFDQHAGDALELPAPPLRLVS